MKIKTSTHIEGATLIIIHIISYKHCSVRSFGLNKDGLISEFSIMGLTIVINNSLLISLKGY